MEKVFATIEANADTSVEHLKRLCRQPSISAQNLGLDEMADLCADTMRECGLEAELWPVPDGPPVVYGEYKSKSSTTLLVYHHYDVQPVDPLEQWQSPPFEPQVRNGKLYSRGAVDNKGALMTRLAAIKAYLDTYGELPISIKFFVEGEEEIGSPHLVSLLQSKRDALAADACLWSGEVTWEHQQKITLGLKGLLYVELEAKGANQDLISSYGTSIINPAWRLVWALGTLKDANEDVLIEGFYRDVRLPSEGDREALRRLPFDDEKVREELGIPRFLLGLSGFDLVVRDLFSPSCSICGIWGGYTDQGAKTVLPSVARAKVDFRLVPDMTPDDILRKLRRHLDKHGFNDITVTPLGDGRRAWRTPMEHPFVEAVRRAAQSALDQEPLVLPIMNASGNMSLFGSLLNLPIATSGVRYPDSRIHAPNENLRLDDLVLGTRHVAAIISEMRTIGK